MRVVLTAPGQAACIPYEVDERRLGPEEVWIETVYSLISSGTEGAAFRNASGTTRYPMGLGYAAVGRVLREGTDFPQLRQGQLVFTYAPHQQYARARVLCLPVPAGLEPTIALFARFITVAMTAVRVSSVELGDRVVVLGQGMVGNLCAQLFQVAGADVLGVDLSGARLKAAEECGVRHVAEGGSEERVRQAVLTFTDGQGAEAVVEAVGRPDLVLTAVKLARKLGEVILLGSPRGAQMADVTELLNHVHLWEHGCVTLKGAHEWRIPPRTSPGAEDFQKHSLQRNVQIAFRLLLDGRVRTGPLLTHVLSPQRADEAYRGLRDDPDRYRGVVFDWGLLGSAGA